MNEREHIQNENKETLTYLASSVANSTIAGIAQIASQIPEKIYAENVTSGYFSPWFGSMKDLFKKEWTIPCIDTRVVL